MPKPAHLKKQFGRKSKVDKGHTTTTTKNTKFNSKIQKQKQNKKHHDKMEGTTNTTIGWMPISNVNFKTHSAAPKLGHATSHHATSRVTCHVTSCHVEKLVSLRPRQPQDHCCVPNGLFVCRRRAQHATARQKRQQRRSTNSALHYLMLC